MYERLESKRSWKPKLFDLKGISRIINSLDSQTENIDLLATLSKICIYHKSDSTGRVIMRGKYTHIKIISTRLYDLSRINNEQKDLMMA